MNKKAFLFPLAALFLLAACLSLADEEAALKAAIAENPRENAPRLIYADWLEEHGQAARAELIRLDVRSFELFRSIAHNTIVEEFQEVEKQRKALLEQHEKQWVPAELRDRVVWDRGFLIVKVTGDELSDEKIRAAIARVAPCSLRIELRTSFSIATHQRLAERPPLAGVAEIEFDAYSSERYVVPSADASIGAVLRSVGGASSLTIKNMSIDSATMDALRQPSYASRLQFLQLVHVNGIPWAQLASRSDLTRLQQLQVTEPGSSDWTLLSNRRGGLPALENLEIQGSHVVGAWETFFNGKDFSKFRHLRGHFPMKAQIFLITHPHNLFSFFGSDRAASELLKVLEANQKRICGEVLHRLSYE